MAATLPAGAALEVTSQAAKQAQDALRAIMDWAAKPIYTNTVVRTRSWDEVDKRGKVQHLVETKSKGWSITNGMVVGTLGLVAVWEIGNGIADAFKPGSTANPLVALMSPALWVVTEIANADGSKTDVKLPPTAMGVLNQLVSNTLAVPAAGAGAISAKALAKIQNYVGGT
jgi:hypothetical protein